MAVKVIYFFDESGEKGFVGPDFTPTQFGLVAGIALPELSVSQFEKSVDEILSRANLPPNVKVHATDIFKDGKNAAIKEELLDFLAKERGWLLVYEAVYPLGIYKAQCRLEKNFNTAQDGNIQVFKNKEKVRIYAELLEGLIFQLDVICVIEESESLLMKTDRIESSLLKEASEDLNVLKKNVHIATATGYDKSKKKVLHGSVKTEILGFDNSVKNITEIQTETGVTTMTFIADLIANTLYRHLSQVVNAQPGIPLHSAAAIAGFKLVERTRSTEGHEFIDNHYSPIK